MAAVPYPDYCRDRRPCFARMDRVRHGGVVPICRILAVTHYEPGECPFCKPVQSKPAPKEKKDGRIDSVSAIRDSGLYAFGQ